MIIKASVDTNEA